MKRAQNLSHEMCGVIIKLWKDARASSVHVRHASVEVQVHYVNVVIGVLVVHDVLLVIHVVPVFLVVMLQFIADLSSKLYTVAIGFT